MAGGECARREALTAAPTPADAPLPAGGTRHRFLPRRKSLADIQIPDYTNIRRYKPTTSLSAEERTPNFKRNVQLQGRGKPLLNRSHGAGTRMPPKFQTVHRFFTTLD